MQAPGEAAKDGEVEAWRAIGSTEDDRDVTGERQGGTPWPEVVGSQIYWHQLGRDSIRASATKV